MISNTYVRKGLADQLTPDQRQALIYVDNMRGGSKIVARPLFGGIKSGFHTALSQGDLAATLYETQNFPIGTIPLVSDPSTLFVLNPGESIMLHPDGRQMTYLQNSGATTIYSDTHGVAVSVSAAQALTMAATTVGITGATTVNGTLHVTGTTTMAALTASGAVTLSGQTLGTGYNITGTVSGSACLINWPHVLVISLNGVTNYIPLLL